MTQCGDCMWGINLYDEYKRKAVMTLSPQGLLPLVVRTKSFPWAKRKAENRLRGQKYHRCELGDLTKGKDTKCLPCPEIFQPLLYLLWIHK